MYYHNLREKILGQVNLLRSQYADYDYAIARGAKRFVPELGLDAQESHAAKGHAKYLALAHKQFELGDKVKASGLFVASTSWLVQSAHNVRPGWHELVAYRETVKKPHDEFLQMVREMVDNDATGTQKRFILAAEEKMAVGFGLRRLGGKRTALYLCLRLKRSRKS